MLDAEWVNPCMTGGMFRTLVILVALPAAAGLVAQRAPSAQRDAVVTRVAATGNLQAALDAGGTIELEPGATFSAARFVVSKSGTTLNGRGAALEGTEGPALYIPPGVHDVTVHDIAATSKDEQSVVQCGDNGPTQTAAAQVPQRISFTKVVIPSHRGKRGFELNCAATLNDSKALDVWAESLQDSQAIAVLNTCGPVTVKGGEYVAASENIMVGGDTLKVEGCIQGDLTFDGVALTKPEEWHTDGVRRGVKNLFELKSGVRVKLLNATLSGSWKAGQDGWAILITPRNGSYVKDVLIDNVTVERVGGGIQFLGRNKGTDTPEATSGILVRNSRFAISRADYGGRGILALMTNGVGDVTWENVTARFDGPAIVQADSKVPQGPFTMRNSRAVLGTYGVSMPGAHYGGAGTPGRELQTVLEGNTFGESERMSKSGLRRFKKAFPRNTYVPPAELEGGK